MLGTLQNRTRCKDGDNAGPRPVATYLVNIAGSAGAFVPMCQLLSDLPFGFNAAVVALLHAGPGGVLAESLRARIKLPICVAEDGQLVRAGQVYVAPAGTHLIINPDARLSLSGAPRLRPFRPSADWLFESAAASFGSRQIVVVLSGMLSDGAAMLRTVKRSGGTVLVQLPEEARFPAMPRAAIGTGFLDQVLPVSGIAKAICAELRRRDTGMDAASWEAPFHGSEIAGSRNAM